MAAYPGADLEAALRSAPPVADAKTGGPTTGLAAWPNPSAGRATVSLSVADASEATIAVYDALGRRVATLHDGALGEGEHTFAFDGADVAPGVYVVTSRMTSATGAVSTDAVRWTRMR